MQRQLVLVEYGKRLYGTGQRCLMHWAGGETERGVETDSGRWSTSGGDMELGCPLDALGLRGLLFDFFGPHGRFNLACRVRDSLFRPPAVVVTVVVPSSYPSTYMTTFQSAC